MHNPWQPAHDRTPVVEAPTGIGVFLEEVILFPRRWAERYYNLQHWQVMPSGGHFAPMEEPQSLVEDLRLFFRRSVPKFSRPSRRFAIVVFQNPSEPFCTFDGVA